MEISLIAAVDKNNGIGRNNQLLCKVKEDMQWFRENTLGKVILMGRKTYESLGSPLKDRVNVVLTHQWDYQPHPDVKVFRSLLEALDTFKDEEEIMVIGGETIYRQTLPLADRLYITEFHKKFKADAFFPEIKEDEWVEVMRKAGTGTEETGFDYSFKLYERKRV